MKPIVCAAVLAAAFSIARADNASYTIDPTHTFVTFEAPHLGTSTLRGRFDKKQGRIELDRAAKTGRAEITIEMDSVDTGVEAFDKFLRSKEFFDTAAHPTAKFAADAFTFDGDNVAAVNGTLELLGQSHPVALKAARFNCYTSPLFKREVCGGDFEATIQRSQWGLAYGMPAIVPDEIHLLVQIEAVRQDAR